MNAAQTPRSGTWLALLLLLLSACSEQSGGPIDPLARPIIQLDRTGVTHGTRQGTPDPDPFVVLITNAGEGQLTGLGARVEYGDPSGPEWLKVELSQTSAPAELRVQIHLGQLPVGRHEARVRVSSSTATEDGLVTVELDLQLPRLPDLYFAGDPHAQDTLVKIGQPVRLTDFQIANGGPAPAAFILRLYHSVDTLLSEDDLLLNEEDMSVSVGAPIQLSGLELPTNRDNPLGRQHFIFVLDPEDALEEWDEANNVAVIPFNVIGMLLDVSIQGVGTVTVSPEAESYEFETSVTLTAEPAGGWVFHEWVWEGGRSDVNPIITRMLHDVSMTAVFHPVVTAPTLVGQVNGTGRADLTWTFDWPCVRVGRTCQTSTEDRYELEMMNLSIAGPYETIHTSPNTRESPYAHSLRLEPGDWHFRVRAVGDGWTSPWSDGLRLAYYPAEPPATPANLQASSSVAPDGRVLFELGWDYAADVDEYFVQVAWDHPDFAGGSTLPGTIRAYGFYSSETPGHRLYFRLEARNAYGSSEGAIAYADVPVRNGTARFVNATDYPVFSLVVDGMELLPGAEAYQRGQWYEMELAPGTYEFR
ncbi:MAG: hypothetical protein OEO23_14795, partial [Gemmatimonadota bacterium]|nr:hypothetical protein [Gemmatimonadota bacterium]